MRKRNDKSFGAVKRESYSLKTRGTKAKKVIKNGIKTRSMLVFLILALLCVSVVLANPKARQTILNSISGNIENANESNAVVSDATIISTKTGTGPWDSDDQPGNDSSENNNIVRSFDQVTWTVDLTMNSKDNKAIAGSKINVEATVPDTLANLVKWDLSSMSWIQNGQVSSDGRTVTGSYTVADTETSSSAKQTLVFVLQVYGAGNATEIIPTFNFNIDENSDTEKATVTAEKVIVSAKGKYNVQLVENRNLNKRVLDLNYAEQSIDGRAYGYAFILQLYNDSPSKGLKGVEYPKGDITFDIDLKLERTKFGSTEREDITKDSVLLWNYKVNYGTPIIANRDMNFGAGSSSLYGNASQDAPIGIKNDDRNCSVYNSGNILMQQNENKIKVTVNNYSFDGIFPKGIDIYTQNVYSDNIGCFSVGYFQVIIPDNESTTVEDRNYYLTISDSNFKVSSITEDNITNQMVVTDDNVSINHVRYSPGTFNHHIYLWGINEGLLQSSGSAGDSVRSIGQELYARSYIDISWTNDSDDYLRTVDRFFKFDGEAFEISDTPSAVGMNHMKWKHWVVTKKDGTNWTSQTDMNNGKIEDMNLYEHLADIPEGYICIGVYIESQGGYIEVPSRFDAQFFNIRLKVKDSAKINTTYAFTETSKYWRQALDRSIYNQERLDSYDTYPTSTWHQENENYIKTEYDANGNIVPGTHSGGFRAGQSVLIVGANLHGDIKAIDSSKSEKVNYDLGKNENIVTYSVEPQLDVNPNLSSQISNVTLKNEVTIPKGLEYIPGSSKRGENSYTEPEITKNSDGSTTLVWYIYGVTSGQAITPITFNASIDNETANGTQYQAKFVVSELIGSDGISKIGNNLITKRTSTVSINIINLESHRLYKEVETPIIEKNGDVTFKITYENKTETAVPDFQMLDILPYNGDNRGSNFNGTYTLKNINVKQTSNGADKGIDNLKIYSTNSDNVKGMTAKDTGIGTDSIWESISNGDVNKQSKGIAIKGEVPGNTKIEVTVTLATNGNSANDVYSNNVMAQVYSNSEQMQSSAVTARVVNRYIEGKVWQDSNTNGVIDDGEKYLGNITLKLINTSNNSEVAKTTTNENGEYSFNDLAKGKYKVAIEVDGTYYYITEKEVGTNVEINSKFNEETEETDEITRLDSLQSPVLVEENVNAGLAIKKIEIPVTKQWNDNNNEAQKRPDGIIAVIKNGTTEVTKQELNNSNNWRYTFTGLPKYDDNLKEINYTVEEQEKNSGDLYFYTKGQASGSITNGYTITNTFSVPDEKVQVQVTKIWDDNGNTAGKRPTSITLKLTGSDGKEYTQQLSSNNAESGNANNWTYTFMELPKYDRLGNEVVYTLSEEATGSIFYTEGNTVVDQDTKTITNTFQVPDETVEVPVTKVWNDNNNEAQKRPESVTIKVTGNGQEYTQEINVSNKGQDDNTWTYTFTLPKYDANGNEIEYAADEEDSRNMFYSKENVTGDMESGYTITNRFVVPDDKVELTVNKVWQDNETQTQRRPEVITINIIGENNKVVQSYDLKVKEETSHTFTDLPKYNSLGNEINYTVEEQEKNIDDLKFYTGSVGDVESTDENSKEVTITNTFIRPEDKVNIIANKVWNDNEEQSNRRPESIILVVKNGDQEVESKEVNSTNLIEGTTNKWSVEFTGLDKYDENGQEIQYTIEEKEKTEGDLHFYQAEENNVAVEDNQATIRNDFVRPEDTTSVTVTKNWNDSNNVNGRRPTSIKLQVKNGENVVSEQEVSAKNNWTYTFTDLPKYDDNGKEIEYTVAEAEVNSGDLKFYTNDNVSGDMTSGYTITNTFKVPDEKVSLTVNKVWKDNAVQSLRRPKVITINVLGESGVVQSYDLNVASETSHTFTDLPKYNKTTGKEITYTVEEQEKNPGDLKFYTSSISGDMNTGYTITNTFKVPDEKANVVVTKVWEDNNNEANKRPTSIKLLLKNETKTLREQEISSNDAEEGNTNTWTYEFTDLDKYNSNGQEIVYTADEAEINSGDLQFYNKKVSGTTITNTFTQDTTKVEVTVNKVWVDTEAQEARRPESVVIVLKANGEEINRAEVSGENQEDKDNWSYTFKDLPKYDEFNNIINYTVDEAEANKGDLKFYSKAIDGTTITNTFTRPTETISIEVNKKWEDQENRYEKRPVSIKYQVKNGEEVVAEKIVTNKDNWEYTFEGLDKYNEEGQEITYTVDEQEVISGDLYYYEKTAGEVTDKAGSVNVKEATVTNTMVKIPSTVVVKYVDKNTGEEISEAKEKEGIIGEEFDVTEDVKEIPGYTLVEEPEEKKGTYTSEVQEKIYYYAKNTKVIVKYLEKDETEEDSDNKVLSEQIEMSGYEGEGYATNSKQIEGYTLVATKGNLSGTMTREEQVVVYYYAKNTKVIVKYLEKDDTPTDTSDNKVLLPENTIEGYVGKEYKTTEEVIPGYTLVQKTTNYEGVMTEDVIEVVYYYAKNTSVVVKYLEQDDTPDNNDDNTVLAEEIVISGYEGKSYETEKKDIENYTFVEDTENTSGTMTKEQIEVIYYYAQNTKAKVQHIDRETGKILKEETTNGKVGDLFKTHAEDFEGYVLVESPEEPNIIMDKTGTQIVKYYYAHVSAGIIEKHIDEITGELLYSEEHKGNEGDPYNIPSKEFAGYDLVTDKLPENSEGTMLRDEVIEVKYYYIKKATVVVKYVDENTGEEIAKEETIEGHENDSYETQEKQIDDYNLVKTPENASGTMVITKNEDGTYNTEIEVIYYYKKIAGGVKENHIDINTGKKLYTEEHKGNVGDEYEIPSKEFEGYDLVTERLPDNSKGTMTEKEIEVNYYYEKQAKVKVEYIDKQTGEKLDEEEIKGHVGDSYETEEKEFDGYDLVEKPSNDKGEMKEEETVVKYYYARKAEVEVKYLEKGTDYEVAEGSTLNGYVGDKYETEQKEIPYYKFIEKTENWKGNMSQEKITVIYYYEKEIFNLGVDKWVSNVNINGIGGAAQNIGNKDEIYKVDIYRKDANTANVKVTYKIRITNKGEIEGTVGRLTDIIPSGYSYNKEDNEIYFENNSGVLTTDALKDEVIQPGEYKEIEVVLRWTGGEGNFGQKDNMVILTELNNPAGYEDIDKEDNADTSSMIITVATGLDRNDRIAIIGIVQIVLVITIGLLLSYKKKEKHQDK